MTETRKMVVPTAQVWFDGAMAAKKDRNHGEAFLCLINAFNHTENALAGERKQSADMLYALKAVDALWAIDAGAGFDMEMSIPSPVGIVWEKVRAAIAKTEGR